MNAPNPAWSIQCENGLYDNQKGWTWLYTTNAQLATAVSLLLLEFKAVLYNNYSLMKISFYKWYTQAGQVYLLGGVSHAQHRINKTLRIQHYCQEVVPNQGPVRDVLGQKNKNCYIGITRPTLKLGLTLHFFFYILFFFVFKHLILALKC